MPLSNYDAWKTSEAEGQGHYMVKCKTQVLFCGKCDAPAELVELWDGIAAMPDHDYVPVACSVCLTNEDLDSDICGEEFESSGYYTGASVELKQDVCPLCGGDDLSIEPSEREE